METETLEARAAKAAEVLRAGGLVLHATETVYGLAADPRQPGAVARARQLKGRDAAKPMLALTDTWARVASYLDAVPPPLARLMAHEAPLAVTLLLPGSAAAPEALRGPDGRLGLRRTADPFCRALVAALGAPILSTSANPAGQPPPARFADVDEALRRAVELALDAGRPLAGVPSTVVGVDAAGRLEVVREGAVPEAHLRQIAEA
ncbi:MAG: L-threonylcarbamoyladenylate synthase [Rubricoccaceae bacterium]